MSASATTMSTQKLVPVLPLKKRSYDMSLFQADGDKCTTVTQILVCPVQNPSYQTSKRRKRRHTFTKEEQKLLEGVFCRKPYPAVHDIIRLSVELGIPETTVKYWFQNKRMKIKGRKNGKIQRECDDDKDGHTTGQTGHQVPSPNLQYDNSNTATMNISNCGVYTNSSTKGMSVNETNCRVYTNSSTKGMSVSETNCGVYTNSSTKGMSVSETNCGVHVYTNSSTKGMSVSEISRISPCVALQKKHKYFTRLRKHLYDQAKESFPSKRSDYNTRVDNSCVITKNVDNQHHVDSQSVDNDYVSNSRRSEQSLVNMTHVTEPVSAHITQLHSKPDKYLCMLKKDRHIPERKYSSSTSGRNFIEKYKSLPNHCGVEGMKCVLYKHQNKPIMRSEKWNTEHFCQGSNWRNIDLSFHDNMLKRKKCNCEPEETCKLLQKKIHKNLVGDAGNLLQRGTRRDITEHNVLLRSRAKRSVVKDTSKSFQRRDLWNSGRNVTEDALLQSRSDVVGADSANDILQMGGHRNVDRTGTKDIDNILKRQDPSSIDSCLTEDIYTMSHKENDLTVDLNTTFYRESDLTEIANTNGLTEVTNTNGLTEVTNTDGLTKVTNTNGLTEVTNTYGLTEVTNTNELTEVTNTNGLTEVTNTNGLTEVTNTNGLTEVTNTNGLTEVTNTNELTEVANTNGLTEVTNTNGLTEVTNTNGLTEVTNTNGLTEVTNTNGLTEVANTNGLTEVTNTNGLTEVTDTNGLTEVTDTNGLTEVTNNNGLTEVTNTNGLTEVTNTNGLTEVTNTNGLTEVTNTNGLTEVTNTNGLTEVTNTNGLTEVTNTNGLTEVTNTNGLTEVTNTNGLTEVTNGLLQRRTNSKPTLDIDNNVIEDTRDLLQSKNHMNDDGSVREDSNCLLPNHYHRNIHRKFTEDIGNMQQNRKHCIADKSVFEHMYNLPERRDKGESNVIKNTIDLLQRRENCNRNVSSEIAFHTLNCKTHSSVNHVNNVMGGFSQTFYQHQANSAFKVMFSSGQSVWPYFFQAGNKISQDLNRWESAVKTFTSNVYNKIIPTSDRLSVYPEPPGTSVYNTFPNFHPALCNRVIPCVSSSAEQTLSGMPDVSFSIEENSSNNISSCRQGTSISSIINPEVSAQQRKPKQSSAKTCLVNSDDAYWSSCPDMSTSMTCDIGHQTSNWVSPEQAHPTPCSAKLPSFLELISGVRAFSNPHVYVKSAPSILKNSNDVDPHSSTLKNPNIVVLASNLFKTPDIETRTSSIHTKPDIVAPASSILRKPDIVAPASSILKKPDIVASPCSVFKKPDIVAPASSGLKNPDNVSPGSSRLEQTDSVTPGSFILKKADFVAPVFTNDESLAFDRNTLSPCITPPSFDIFDNCINTDLQVDSPSKPSRNFLIMEDDGVIGDGLHFCSHYSQQY